MMTTDEVSDNNALLDALPPSHIFNLNLWYDSDRSENDHWKGSIQSLETGNRTFFHTISDLVDMISDIIEESEVNAK
jgi:hypothetical protein